MHDSNTVKPKGEFRQFQLSLRNILIVVALIAVSLTATRWWILSHTYYEVDAILFLEPGEIEKIQDPKRNYGELPLGLAVYPSTDTDSSRLDYVIHYQSKPSQLELKETITELRKRLIATVRNVADLQFESYQIRNLTLNETLESGDANNLK